MTKETRDEKISVRFRPTEKEEIQACADAKDISVAQLIREAIREYIRKEQQKQ